MRGQYVYKTVTPDTGGKEHIVRQEENSWGWVTVVCGHNTFEPPFNRYTSVEELKEEDICKNCLGGLNLEYGQKD